MSSKTSPICHSTGLLPYCGGNQRDVTRSIQAYSDMEEFYRPLCEPNEFNPERFSGFAEFQNPRIREAVLAAGFSGSDFAGWLKGNSKIGPLQEVRQLPAVLKDKRAREVFLKKNMKEAAKVLDRPETDVDLATANLSQLARALESKANQTSMEELRSYKNDDGATLRHIEASIDSLQFLRDQILGEN